MIIILLFICLIQFIVIIALNADNKRNQDIILKYKTKLKLKESELSRIRSSIYRKQTQ